MPERGLSGRGLTLGAALSNSTRERPCASLPVTTRRIGFIASAMHDSLSFRTRAEIATIHAVCQEFGAEIERESCLEGMSHQLHYTVTRYPEVRAHSDRRFAPSEHRLRASLEGCTATQSRLLPTCAA